MGATGGRLDGTGMRWYAAVRADPTATMTTQRPAALARLGRNVAVLIIARLLPGRGYPELLEQVAAMPLRAQAGITLGVLGLLLAAALVAAQFGPLGLAAYFAGVVLLAR